MPIECTVSVIAILTAASKDVFSDMLETIHETHVVPLGIGYYTVPEAARLLRTAPRNISRWLDGYSYRGADGNMVKSSPLWRAQLPRLGDALEIGFRDVIE